MSCYHVTCTPKSVYIKSEIGFAFSHLLGFRLLPRLKPIHSQRLALVEAGTQDDYPHLKEVLGKAINWEAIRQQYDMMVKYAAALKTGTADADALLRRFTRSNLQHPTYQGLHELGRVIKTIFLSVTWNTAHQQEKTGLFFSVFHWRKKNAPRKRSRVKAA